MIQESMIIEEQMQDGGRAVRIFFARPGTLPPYCAQGLLNAEL